MAIPSSLLFLRNATADGLGVAMIPTWLVQDELKYGHLIALLGDFPLDPSGTPITAILAHNRHLAPKVGAFVDFLTERLDSIQEAHGFGPRRT